MILNTAYRSYNLIIPLDLPGTTCECKGDLAKIQCYFWFLHWKYASSAYRYDNYNLTGVVSSQVY